MSDTLDVLRPRRPILKLRMHAAVEQKIAAEAQRYAPLPPPPKARAERPDYRPGAKLLAELFPAAFVIDGSLRPPLKVGIYQDILDLAPLRFDAQTPGPLRMYCRHDLYLGSLTEGAMRLDLEGNPTALVTAEQAEHAAGILAKRARP